MKKKGAVNALLSLYKNTIEGLLVTINEITKFDDIRVIDINHTFEQITEKTDLKGLEFTKH